MNETLKQNRLLRDHGDEGPGPYSPNDKNLNDPAKDVHTFCVIFLHPSFSFSHHKQQNNLKGKLLHISYNVCSTHTFMHVCVVLDNTLFMESRKVGLILFHVHIH